MLILLVSLLIVLFLVAGAALAYATGAGAVLFYIASGMGDNLALAPQLIFSQVDVFALMAMPLFILVGEIMNRGRITHVLVDFAMALVGRTKGGLGHVNVLTSVFFAGISGSAVADAAALGNTLVPAMVDKGYSKSYAGAITAASSLIGPIIPPSIILIFYGATMGVDVAALFTAGIGPGLLLAGALLVANGVIAHRYDHPGGGSEDSPSVWASFKLAIPALALPMVIILGIVFGVTTPTEAAAIAVFAAIGVGYFYKTMDSEKLLASLRRTVVLTGTIFMLFAAAGLVIYLAALSRLPQLVADAVTTLELTGTSYLLAIALLFLLFGMVLDTLLGLVLVAPVLVPVAISQGADPVHVGICVCLTLAMGLVTPPLGGSVLVVSAVTGTNYWELFRWVIPLLLVEVVVLIAVISFPAITLFLPRLLGMV